MWTTKKESQAKQKKTYKRKSNGKKATGRPTKLTEDTVKKLEEIFRIDGSASEACSYAEVSEVSYYDWLKKDDKFSKRMRAAQKYPFIVAKRSLFAGVEGWDQRSTIEFLKRREKNYKDKVEQEVKLDGDFNSMTDEELLKIAKGK